MILVTGATGHIGNVLVRSLREKGKQVRTLVLPGEDRRPLQGMDVEIVEGDVTIPETLDQAMKGVKNVYHLAGIISILPGKNDLLRRVNVQGTINVIQSCLKNGVNRLVYTSSIHAIQRVAPGIIIDETIPFDPGNPYGEYDRAKAEASLAVLEAATHGLDAVVACPTGVIGPYDYRRSEMGQVLLDCVDEKPQLYIEGAYDFVDVRDVAEGLILAEEKGVKGETYILSGERITVTSILDTMQKSCGLKFPRIRLSNSLARFAANFTPLFSRLTHTPPRFTSYSIDVLESNSNISHAKAQRDLGYLPRSLRLTLIDTVRWFQANRDSVYNT
jgi:dihydroflavonol-4-reductase